MKIAILIAHANRHPFNAARELTELQIATMKKKYGIDTFYVSGLEPRRYEKTLRDRIESIRWTRFFIFLRFIDYIFLTRYKKKSARCKIFEQEIQVMVPEDIRHLIPKLISAYEYFQIREYDWVIRTTVFSLIFPRNLLEVLRKVESNKPFVGGRIVEQEDGTSFISGSFTVLNRLAIERVLSERKILDIGLIDDVAFSKLFRNLGFSFSPLPSIDIPDTNGLLEMKRLKNKVCHARCRSNTKKDSDLVLLADAMKTVDLW